MEGCHANKSKEKASKVGGGGEGEKDIPMLGMWKTTPDQ